MIGWLFRLGNCLFVFLYEFLEDFIWEYSPKFKALYVSTPSSYFYYYSIILSTICFDDGLCRVPENLVYFVLESVKVAGVIFYYLNDVILLVYY